jgi:hypothetical protein
MSEYPLQSRTSDYCVDRRSRVCKCPKLIALYPVIEILKPSESLYQPMVRRIDNPIELRSSFSRKLDQLLHIVVATNDSVQGNDIGFGYFSCQFHEIAMVLAKVLEVPLAFGFFPCGLKVGTGSIDAGSGLHSDS